MNLRRYNSLGALVALLATAAASAVFVTSACAPAPDGKRVTYLGPLDDGTTLAPDFNGYKAHVDAFLAARCASLDCHGQVGRPMRLFSVRGLRAFDAAGGGTWPNDTGSGAVTDDEIDWNYYSVIGLEPEAMAIVVSALGANADDPKPANKLLLLKKPQLLEGHKGGQVMVNGDDGFACLTSWLAGSVDADRCAAAAKL